MKIKRVNEVVLKMLPGEVDIILADIEAIIDNYVQGDPYPLALHDFAEELKASEFR